MSINKILNKRDRNYVKSVLIDEIGIHPATEKILFENTMNFIKRFSITKYNCNEKFIENLFKHYDINSQNKLRKVCLNKESLSNSEILITSIKDQVCGKIVKNKNKKFVNLKEDYRPSKHDIKFIKLLINT